MDNMQKLISRGLLSLIISGGAVGCQTADNLTDEELIWDMEPSASEMVEDEGIQDLYREASDDSTEADNWEEHDLEDPLADEVEQWSKPQDIALAEEEPIDSEELELEMEEIEAPLEAEELVEETQRPEEVVDELLREPVESDDVVEEYETVPVESDAGLFGEELEQVDEIEEIEVDATEYSDDLLGSILDDPFGENEEEVFMLAEALDREQIMSDSLDQIDDFLIEEQNSGTLVAMKAEANTDLILALNQTSPVMIAAVDSTSATKTKSKRIATLVVRKAVPTVKRSVTLTAGQIKRGEVVSKGTTREPDSNRSFNSFNVAIVVKELELKQGPMKARRNRFPRYINNGPEQFIVRKRISLADMA